MPLETLSTDGVNLRQLTLPEPTQNELGAFDSSREITTMQKKGMRNTLKKELEAGRCKFALDIEVCLALAGFPTLTEEEWERVEQSIEQEREHDRDRFMYSALSMGLLGRKLQLTDEEKERLEADIRTRRMFEMWWIIAERAATLVLQQQPSTLTEKDSINFAPALQRHMKYGDVQNWHNLATLGASMRILGHDVRVTKEMWDGLRGAREELCEFPGDWHRHAGLTARMIILAAPEIRISEQGLEIVPRKNLKLDVQPLPRLRQFVESI